MKIDKIYLPISDLETGDIVTLDANIVLDYRDNNLFTPIHIASSKMILDTTTIGYSNYIVSLVCEQGIFETIPVFNTACLVLESWKTRKKFPIFAKDIELGDVLLYSIDEHSHDSAKIVEIYDNYSDGTRIFTLSESLPSPVPVLSQPIQEPVRTFSLKNTYPPYPASLKHETFKLTCRYTDLVTVPASTIPATVTDRLDRNYPPSIESECYWKNLALLLKSVSHSDTQYPCTFLLGKPCKRQTLLRYHGKHICETCIKKIAAIAVYGGRDIINTYNEKFADAIDVNRSPFLSI